MTALILSSGRQFTSVDELLNFAEEQHELNLQLRQDLGLVEDRALVSRLIARWALTPKEAALLQCLYARGGMIATKEQILHAIYGHADTAPEVKIVDVFACKIRGKVGAEAIVTEWGAGYRMSGAFLAEVNALAEQPIPEVARAPTAATTRPRRINLQTKALTLFKKHGDLTVSELTAVFPERTTYHHTLSVVDVLKRAGRVEAVSEKRGRTGATCKVYRMTPVGQRYLRQNAPAL